MIDCDNGRDESVEACWEDCLEEDRFNEDAPKICWRCVNGVRLDESKVCDGHIDCFDGSDELPTMCNYANKKTIKCYEPYNYKFTDDTSFQSDGQRRFVYAHEAAKVNCGASGLRSWNVCLQTGKWHHKFCSNKMSYTPRNLDPDTNGTNGCPIDMYYNGKMSIWFTKNGEELTKIQPPIVNKLVELTCSDDYKIVPSAFRNKNVLCQKNKTWQNGQIPSCTSNY